MRLHRKEITGLLFALLGVFAFSLSIPMTKWALESFDPFFTATARPVIACLLAIPFLLIAKVPKFPREHFRALLFTTLGGTLGWPILIALALQKSTSAHVAVIAAIMPLTTAIIAVLRTDTSVSWQFWAASLCGTTLLIIFALTRGGGAGGSIQGDIFTVLAVLSSSICYVEGVELTRVMPGWQVISWVVILAMPFFLPASIWIFFHTHSVHPITTHGLIGLAIISFSSMYLGFFAWYRGLRDAGTAHGSQVQQLQAIMTLGWSALLLGEKVTFAMVLIALGVIGSVFWALISRQGRGLPQE
ncbi:MAG: DMT family transporter [Actinomycetota bacterium]